LLPVCLTFDYFADMQSTERFTFRADSSLADALKDFCSDEDLTPSQVTRKALKAFAPLKKYFAKSKSTKRKTEASK
jgi:hypothetical protein